MGGSQGGARARSAEDIIADVLAYFAAKKRYAYVDMLGNALDNIIALEALKDAIRDFKSSCIDNPGSDDEAVCPSVRPEELERAGEILASTLARSDTKQLILVTREIAVKALARAPKFSRVSQSSSGGGEQ
ncbi:MAG: hypothetical protein F7C34_03740 [Desulfurococcales archaeon]|nr:hypothetical protein [Desulfurococcales archaeon]